MNDHCVEPVMSAVLTALSKKLGRNNCARKLPP